MPVSHLDYKLYYHRRLPHYQPHDSFIFITFRLAFSIPADIQNSYSSFKQNLIKAEQSKVNNDKAIQARNISKKLFAYYDRNLNAIDTPITLTASSNVAGILSKEIEKQNGIMYYLACYTIMPNHVHILLRPLSINGTSVALPIIMKSIKGSSSYLINKVLERKGSLWAREYYDYWVRTEQEFNNIVAYIRFNPVEAKLVVESEYWQWTWINPDLLGEKTV